MIKRLFVATTSCFLFFIFFHATVHANGSLYIEDYDVAVVVHEDSTFDVSETISYRATGKFGKIYREVTLEDKEAVEKCKTNEYLQCGGFSYITVTGVYDSEGNEVSENEYTLQQVSTEYEDRLRIEWEYAPNKRTFNNELFTWTIEYKVFGGLGYFDSYDFFYWDVFYPERDYKIEHAQFDITFPEDIEFVDENLEVWSYYENYDFYTDYDAVDYSLSIQTEDLIPNEEFTVGLIFPKGIVDEPASLILDMRPGTQDVWIDGIEVLNVSESFDGIPPGTHEFTFTASGYKPYETELTFEPGEEKELNVELEMTPWRILMMIGIVLANVLSCFGGVGLLGFFVWRYMHKGRDIGGRKTIVPWFKAPEGISPVLVGSIKDEKVDAKDITATIINAAVRGFIKIKETGKKKYTLTKVKEFVSGEPMKGRKVNYNVLDKSEVYILQQIFDGKNEVETEDLKNKFYKKVSKINDEIYEEMQNRKYFEKRPDHVRRNNLIAGIILLVVGGVLTVVLPFITIFTCGPALALAGIIQIILSFFMPAKTEKGTLIYERCKGFRMFLRTTERFKVKKQLTPEMFEQFLPYAMVFGVEKQWAENFKDIYTEPPSWYQGRDGWTTFNSIYLVNSLATMNTNVSRIVVSSPRSSSSGWSGGGWSGGGGFSGGFSGGGGGGGGGGMS